MCVQLSTISPGMLVCLRHTEGHHNHHEESFPPQDALVFNYFQNCREELLDAELPATKEEHLQFNKAHLGVLAWLTVYCQTFAYYLAHLKARAVACFGPTRSCGSDPQLCWQTIVYQLAAAIHSSDFVPHKLFNEPELCRSNPLLGAPQKRRRTVQPGQSGQSAGPPQLFGTSNLRSAILEHICTNANDLCKTMCETLKDRLEEPELLARAIQEYLKPQLNTLEASAPDNAGQPFYFLALDECGSMADLLPAIRRVWFHAFPRRTWILLVDTNLSLAPLAGNSARKATRRIQSGSIHRLTEPFSDMPLDVKFTEDQREKLFADQCEFSLKKLNLLLPALGRPLWHDRLYCTVDKLLNPRPIIDKLVYPAGWQWDIQAEDSWNKFSEINENLLALASRRILLEVTSRSDPWFWYSFVQSQIAQHLRFVGRIFNASGSIITSAPSEPPLSAAAAWLFRSEPDFTRHRWGTVIEALVRANKPVGFNLSAKGEQGVAVLCTMAIDVAVSQMYSDALKQSLEPSHSASTAYRALYGLVPVRRWLKLLIGERIAPVAPSAPSTSTLSQGDQGDHSNAGDAMDEDPSPSNLGFGSEPSTDSTSGVLVDPLSGLWRWADRAWLNFKHIVRLEEQVQLTRDMDADVLVNLWFRHAAAQGISNQPGWDLLIPIYESSSNEPPDDHDKFDKAKLSYVAIQVNNRLKRPSEEVRGAPVGPRLQVHTNKECLELFIDLKGQHQQQQGHGYWQRRHPTPKPNEPAQSQQAWRLLRHHIYIAGQDATTFPELGKLVSPAKDLVGLLFGSADSQDTVEFDQKMAAYVRSQHDQTPWDEAQMHMDGVLVSLRPKK